MPGSMDEGKVWAREAILSLAPRRILDVGPGIGRYRDLINGQLKAEWWGVEAWAPYVEQFDLTTRYDRIIVADVRWLDWASAGRFDLVILGDVLEHMPRADALRVWSLARLHAGHVLLSLPIVPYPQGPEGGNPFEEHVETWTHTEVWALPGIVSSEAHETVGVYLARGLA